VTTWVALVRGINLGRARRLAMADLRSLLEGLGCEEVRTLLQSGNAVFATTGRRSAGKLEDEIAAALDRDLGLPVDVLVRSAGDLAKVVKGNPFAKAGVDVKQLHASFLSAKPAAKAVSGVDPKDFEPDEFAFGDRVVYLRLPTGVAGSRIPLRDWEQQLGVRATMRTWNTVTRLNELASD
jgi:uncharacterized protein (DUF1697 family)